MSAVASDRESRIFTIEVLGRTLELLGTQMYKRRDAALAELIANSWDAGATWADLTIPVGAPFAEDATITIVDDGVGMSPDQVQSDYLVLGRNRREHSDDPPGRPVMGRKGIGKLAGFAAVTARTLEGEAGIHGCSSPATLKDCRS